ncbi:hypothetical protein N665_0693s0002 [Sinapis alba]|nr:hypothetical protein N665_0693s0002 [Sinapis alba]
MAQKVCMMMMMMALIMIGCHLEACSGMENMSKEDHPTPMETTRPEGVPDPVCIRNCSVTCHTKKECQDCLSRC